MDPWGVGGRLSMGELAGLWMEAGGDGAQKMAQSGSGW